MLHGIHQQHWPQNDEQENNIVTASTRPFLNWNVTVNVTLNPYDPENMSY
jgi:hypothetical protein